LAKEAGDLTVSTNKACFDRRSEENECNYGTSAAAGRIHT